MCPEENVALIKSGAKIFREVRYILFFIFAQLLMNATFSRFFFLRDIFQLNSLKTKKTLEWAITETFEANVAVTINSLHNYKSVNQHNVLITSSQIISYLVLCRCCLTIIAIINDYVEIIIQKGLSVSVKGTSKEIDTIHREIFEYYSLQ